MVERVSAVLLLGGLMWLGGFASPAAADTWTDYATIGPDLLTYEQAYPNLAKRYDLGLSFQGRHLWAIRISDNVLVEEDEPEFKYIATMHGNEIVGTKMCMLLIDYLLTNYDPAPPQTQVDRIVEEVELWIVPLMNPDGYVRSPRTRDNAQGFDLNRNFPEYGQPNSPTGRPTEVQVIMNWSFGRSFTCSANFHCGALVVNYPFDNDDSGSQYSPDDDLFIVISEDYSRYNLPMWNGDWYHGITNGADWYSIWGGMQDWNYHFMGNNEVTIEMSNIMEPPASTIPQYWSENRQSMLAYIETCLLGVRGIVTGPSGEALACTVTVEGRDHEIYTDPNVGDYHRMVLPGTYDLTFAPDGYAPLTIPNVVVAEGDATRLDVSFAPGPPVTSDVEQQVIVNLPAQITLAGYDANGDPLDFIILTLPAHGDLADRISGPVLSVPHTLAGQGNVVVYTPDNDYLGPDGFQFKANDGGEPPDGGDSNISAVNIAVSNGPQQAYFWPLDANPGWTTQGEWAFGHPTGQGGQYGEPDPSNGYTGTNVYGYNLNGDYANSIPEYHLTTTAIDCSELSDVELRFQRWLGVEQPSYDHAYVRISNDGTNWTTIWQNSGTMNGGSWEQQVFDISSVADNQATVYIRWTMGSTDSSWRYCGWNIDDVEIWGIIPFVPDCPWDIDGNGQVNPVDSGIVMSYFGCEVGGGNPQCDACDIDGNGVVNPVDSGVVMSLFGPCP